MPNCFENCPICGARKPRAWALCADCLAQYGSYETWPEWLRFLAASDRRLKRQHMRLLGREFSTGLFQDDSLCLLRQELAAGYEGVVPDDEARASLETDWWDDLVEALDEKEED